MAEVRNAIPLPGVTETAPMGEDNILYSTANLVKMGFTFAEAGKVLPMGTVVGVITASNKYGEYDAEATNGLENPVGILLDEIDVTGTDALANVALGGEFLHDKLTGLDDEAIDALGGVVVNLGKTKVFRF